MKMRLLFAVAITAALNWSIAHAANVSIANVEVDRSYGESCLKARILFSGDIVSGDVERLAGAIAKVDDQAKTINSNCFLNDAAADRLIYVDMQSRGGLYIEALRLAKLLSSYETNAATYVRKDSYCYAACAIAFLGGSVPGADGAFVPRRILHPTAKLGFQAPFPVLSEKAYTADTVQGLFSAAFTVVSEFGKDAKKLGIKPDVAQILLEPRPDRFFEIDTVGRALLTNVTVSAYDYSFSVYSAGVKAIPQGGMLNLCYNNQILKASGDSGELKSFLDDRDETPPALTRSIKARYFENKPQPTEATIVPVEDMGEGEVQSCIALVGTSNGQGLVPKGRPVYSCLGFADGGTELADKISKQGIENFKFGARETCSTDSKLALLPRDMRLQDIPVDFQGN